MFNHEIKVYLLVNKKKLFFHTQTSHAYFYTLNTWRRHWITSVNVNNLTTIHHSDAVLLWWKPQTSPNTLITKRLYHQHWTKILLNYLYLSKYILTFDVTDKTEINCPCRVFVTSNSQGDSSSWWLQPLVTTVVDWRPTTIEC